MAQNHSFEQIRGRGFRFLGLPLQFLIVACVSLLVTIYFAGWAASTSVEARAASASTQIRAGPLGAASSSTTASVGPDETEIWERAALWVCPLH